MSHHREEHLDLCAGYALGSLEAEDRAALEEHLREGCPVCECALAEYGGSLVLLAAALPAAPAPSPGVRERVLRAARADRPDRNREAPRIVSIRPKRRTAWIAAVGWAAAAVLAVTAGTFWETIHRMREEIQLRDGRIAELRRDLALESRWVAVLSAPGARVAEMTLTPEGQVALQGRAIFDPASGRALVVLRHALPPSGRDYQLWAIQGGTPVNLGVVRADATGLAVARLERVGDPRQTQAFAVSLEPRGGSPNPAAPSGPVVLVGALGG